MKSTTPEVVPSQEDQLPTSNYALAFAKFLPRMEALSASQLPKINVDIPSAVMQVFCTLPQLAELRPTIVAALPGADMSAYDELEEITWTLAHAQACYLGGETTPAELPQLLSEAITIRDLLAEDATGQARRGRFPKAAIEASGGNRNYKRVAFELLTLANLFREHWSEIVGKTAVDANELTRAEELAEQILVKLSAKENGDARALADTRLRAFCLFVTAYDEVRRMVTYVRWHEGDADTFAPSLFASRKASKKKSAPPAEPTTPAPTTPSNENSTTVDSDVTLPESTD